MSAPHAVRREARVRQPRRRPGPVFDYENGVPVVPVTARQYRGQWSLHLAACPYCGEPHLHGGGMAYEHPQDHAGHRASHCLEPVSGDVGYILRIVEDGFDRKA